MPTRKTIIYQAGTPPKRGVYPVKSDGPNPNPGYRYWNGRYWGCIASTFAWARERGDTGRRSQLKYPVLWGRHVPIEDTHTPPPLSLREQDLQRQLQEARNALAVQRNHVLFLRGTLHWIQTNSDAHPTNRAKVIEKAMRQTYDPTQPSDIPVTPQKF